jgi:hypothetical protein
MTWLGPKSDGTLRAVSEPKPNEAPVHERTWQRCIPSDLSRLSLPSRLFLAVMLVLFVAFALLRAAPINTKLSENNVHVRGDLDRNVARIYRLATNQADKPFFEVRNHALFFDRNPGLFMFSAELMVRAGARSPYPMQMVSIAMWVAGLIFLYLWLLRLFESEVAAAAGLGLTLSTPFVLYSSVSIHHEPWCFLFFNIAAYAFARYCEAPEASQRRWLVGSCAAYFVLCLNYWFYYLGAFFLLVAFMVRWQRLSLRTVLIVGAVPVAGALATFVQVVYALGGVSEALFKLSEIAAARTLDMRVEGTTWYPDKTFVTKAHLQRYPSIVMERIEQLSGYSAWALFALLAIGLALAGRQAWPRYRWVPLAVLGGLSWNLVMIQHTVIHKFAAMYGFFMWSIIAGLFALELHRAFRPERARVAMIALTIPFALDAASHVYTRHFMRYANAIATNVPADMAEKAAKAKAKAVAKKPKKKS